MGNLIAFVCKIAVNRYGNDGCVSLLPKTALKAHYIEKYEMIEGGPQVFLHPHSLYVSSNIFINLFACSGVLII